MSREIIIAKHAGFCFGVKRATEKIEQQIGQGKGKIYTLGHLIHNPSYLARLEKNEDIEKASEEIDKEIAETAENEVKKEVISESDEEGGSNGTPEEEI